MNTHDEEVEASLVEIDAEVSSLLTRAPEIEVGNLEYKYRLTNLKTEQRDHLVSQMRFRLQTDDEFGQCRYDIGLTDNGFALGLSEEEMKESLKNLHEIAELAGAKICDIRRETVEHQANSEQELVAKYLSLSRALPAPCPPKEPTAPHCITRHLAEVLIRAHSHEGDYIDLLIGVEGNVDAGKSTLVGVLTKGVLDNGNGAVRTSVFNYKHEVTTGRTSSIGQQIMGFNDRGENVADVISLRRPKWSDIVSQSTKVVTFFDLAGHKRYLKTTIRGMISNKPDYAMIVVGANMGLSEMTVEHINLCLSTRVPFFVVITKIDLAPAEILKTTYQNLELILKKKIRRLPYKISSETDILHTCGKVLHGDLVPVFFISNVSGEGLPLLKMFLNYLPIRKSYRKVRSKPTRIQIQETFHVTGVGAVAAGRVTSGTAKIGDELLLGPNSVGEFQTVKIRTIECKRTPVESVHAGKYACFSIPGINRSSLKVGMYLVAPELKPRASWEFIATIWISASRSANIKVGYQPYCHIGHISQSCRLLEFLEIQRSRKTKTPASDSADLSSIGPGDTAKVKMRFCYKPELLFAGENQRLLFREDFINGVGIINECL